MVNAGTPGAAFNMTPLTRVLLRAVALSMLPAGALAAPPSFDDILALRATTPYYAFPTTWIAPPDAQFQRRSEASAVTLANGDVLVAWCDLMGRGDNAKGIISAVELDAAGRPRGEPRLLVPTPPGGLNALSPALRRLTTASSASRSATG